jgi:hypothetical protein
MAVSTKALDSVRLLAAEWTIEHVTGTSLAEVDEAADRATGLRTDCGGDSS